MIREWLTDNEKRILFCAIRREKKLCEELDKKMIFNPLVPIVECLEAKFYYDELFKEIEVEAYNQAIDDFIQHAKKSEYQVEGVDITPAFIKTIEYLAEEVRSGEHE